MKIMLKTSYIVSIMPIKSGEIPTQMKVSASALSKITLIIIGSK